MGLRFELEGIDLCLITLDGRRLVSYVEVVRQAENAEQRAENTEQRAEWEAQRAAVAEQRVESAEQRAEWEAQRAERETQRAAAAESKLARLWELLNQQGIDFAG